jgi:hypothetical protein
MGETLTVLPAPTVGAQQTDLVSSVEVEVPGGVLTTINSTQMQ